MRKIIIWCFGGILALCGTAALGFAAYVEVTTDEPPFTVVRSEDVGEIRIYPPMIVAEVAVSGTRADAASTGFRPLAGFIFGANHQADEIAMTAPVLQQQMTDGGAEIAMTAPVIQQPVGGNSNQWTIRFVMPPEWTLDTLPIPNDPAVTLSQVPGRRMAVVQFSGVFDEKLAASSTAALEAYLMQENLLAIGEPMFAFYDPPWIPGILRRNEVMIEIADGHDI